LSREDALAHLALADEKLVVARSLLEDSHLRDAASRAYYAMYHAAYALVRTKGHAPKTHRGLTSQIAQEFIGAHGIDREQFAALRAAQSIRERGDYEATAPPSEEGVEELIAQAAGLIERVRLLV